jgi:hypothetical protein
MSPRTSLRTLFTDPANRRAVVSGAVTVVILALVIVGITAFGSSSAPKNVGTGHGGSSAIEASDPAASGELSLGTTTSATLASKTATAPSSTTRPGSSGSQGGGSNGGGSGSGSGSGGGSGGGSGTLNSSGKISDLGAALPTAFAGYSVGVPSKQGADAVVSATPLAGAAAAQRIIWAVHDRGSASSAKSFVTKVSKTTYEVDAANVTIRGISAYYGTDGMRFATVVFTREQYVFEVLGTAASGDPDVVRSTVLSAAGAFPVLSAK